MKSYLYMVFSVQNVKKKLLIAMGNYNLFEQKECFFFFNEDTCEFLFMKSITLADSKTHVFYHSKCTCMHHRIIYYPTPLCLYAQCCIYMYIIRKKPIGHPNQHLDSTRGSRTTFLFQVYKYTHDQCTHQHI
jgi:hypothetical protein